MILYSEDGQAVYVARCPLCGTRQGDGWRSFPEHVRREHGPEDAGLSPIGERNKEAPKAPA